MSSDTFQLGKLYVGTIDGDTEAGYRTDFERLFYDFDNLKEKVSNKAIFLVSGRKGTGKTYFAHYLKKTLPGPTSFCESVSFADFQVNTLLALKSSEPSPNEFFSIWEWYYLVVLARMITRDNGIQDKEAKADIEKFVNKNFESIAIGTYKILEITKENSIGGDFKFIKGALTSSAKYAPGSFLNYIESLRTTVVRALASSGSKYTVLIDSLDDKFNDSAAYKDSIISLIKAAKRLNGLFNDEGSNAKIILFLRTDILNLLNDSDLDKTVSSNGIEINWGNRVQKDAPIFKMIFAKIRQTAPSLASFNDLALFDMLFPKYVNMKPTEKYLLERTLFRPRDLVFWLSEIIEKNKDKGSITEQMIKDAERDYAVYFLKEIRNELFGYVPDSSIINDGISLLKHFGKRRFWIKDLNDYYISNKDSYPKLENTFIPIMRLFYRTGLLGSIWKPSPDQKEFTSWGYRDYMTSPDLTKEFVLHRGAYKEIVP